ncbi:dioxygenase [uncultured Microbacterium sp.]|uniref:dioxygenase family protein n=1 Tax=uncultured Microbacterium sp. TaxID=191216 RepID=UPI0035CA66B7
MTAQTTDYNADTLTDAVVASFANTANARTRQVLESLTRHLHAFVREVEPTIQEWEYGIDFLTATGHKSDDTRQEFILLSDVLGISMLVETINDAETPDATDSTVLGPFHMVASPVRELGANISPESDGPVCLVRGRVLSISGDPIPHARLDLWQANTHGFYDVQQPGIQTIGNGRGLITADQNGEFWFRSVVPSYYPIPTDGPVGVLLDAAKRHPYRPAHIHFIVSAVDYDTLTTHIFVEGSPYIDSDAVFAVKRSLITHFAENADAALAGRLGLPCPFLETSIDIVLHPSPRP